LCSRAAARLKGTGVAVASVIGFPFGATLSEIKAHEARRVIRDGAREIDMVISIGALKSGLHDLVRADIAAVSDACHESGALNKVIIETALLTDQEKVVACRLAKEAKADFVKTSTGYASGVRRRAHARGCRAADRREGLGRDPDQGRRRGDDRRRGHPDRRLGRRQDRER
jgi:deoxyribose-phosphate aldolase